MSATTRMLVLGAVRIFQPVHGYDVRRELVSWHAEEWAQVAPGSIYNALKTLTRDGFLEIVGTDQVGGRPERTTYRLTTRGEQELTELLRDTWWTVRMPLDPLAAGVALILFMPRDEGDLGARGAHRAGAGPARAHGSRDPRDRRRRDARVRPRADAPARRAGRRGDRMGAGVDPAAARGRVPARR